jgi:hypothetical protein
MMRTLAEIEPPDTPYPRLVLVRNGPLLERKDSAELTPPKRMLPRSGTETAVATPVVRTTGCWTVTCACSTEEEPKTSAAIATRERMNQFHGNQGDSVTILRRLRSNAKNFPVGQASSLSFFEVPALVRIEVTTGWNPIQRP